MRKRLSAQIVARRKQDVPADVESMDADLRAMLDIQIGDLERRIESVIAQEETSAVKAKLLRSIPGIGPVSAAMLIAEMPELGRMTAGEAAAMTGLAPVPHDSGTMRGKRAIAEGRRALLHVLFQAALAAACRNPVLKPVAQRLKMRGKPHKLVIVAIARRLVTIANAILKTGVPWRKNQSHKHSCKVGYSGGSRMMGRLVGRRELLFAAAALLALPARIAHSQAEPPIHVVKGRGCECCEAWGDYLREQGFTVTDEVSMGTLLIRYKMDQGVPVKAFSFHTGTVEEYALEGHVPAADIRRLLAERPDAVGLAVPDMPYGSPGMGSEDSRDAYDVLLIQRDGSLDVYTSYSSA